MIHNKKNIKRNEKMKPLFYCPYHKVNNAYFPFKDENIFPCNIHNCFCGNINGWVSNCEVCGKIIHNCIHGCTKGINIYFPTKKHPNKIDQEMLQQHYKDLHQGQVIYLHSSLDDSLL